MELYDGVYKIALQGELRIKRVPDSENWSVEWMKDSLTVRVKAPTLEACFNMLIETEKEDV